MNGIIGIDPGTTTAYAVLNLDGKIIKIDSGRGMSLSELLKSLVGIDCIIAGTDKKNCPEFIKKFAAAKGARIAAPEEDLLIEEKRRLASPYEKENCHELDAVASAAYALRAISPLIFKIRKFIEDDASISGIIENDRRVLERIEKDVIQRDVSIKKAIDKEKRRVEQRKDEERKLLEIEKERLRLDSVDENKTSREDIRWMKERIERLSGENAMLSKYNRKIKKNLKSIEKRLSLFLSERKMDEKYIENKIERKTSHKNASLAFLQRKIAEMGEEISALKLRNAKTDEFISELGSKMLLKKLENLGWNEQALKALKIRKNDILLVKEPNIYSEKTLDFLRDKVFTIIFEKKPGKEIAKKFAFIDKSKIRIYENGNFALASPEDIEREKEKDNIFKRIIEEYKEEKRKA
ncbi:MAG: DUF460 domain-containing protein [Candidatus Woesearchaeota archaeon]|nr:DUF460 domain-containing protein [Candidatus Woesearchaeota archaeon]